MRHRRHSPPRWWLWLGLWTAVGLAIRLATVYSDPEKVAGGDAYFYHYGANLLVSGHGFINPYLYIPHQRPSCRAVGLFPPAVHPPRGCPLGRSASRPSWPNGCGAASSAPRPSWWCGYTGREIGGRRVGLIAAFLLAVYPNIWMTDELALSETIAPLLVAGVLFFTYRFWKSPSVPRAVWLGVAIGVAMLGRDELSPAGVVHLRPHRAVGPGPHLEAPASPPSGSAYWPPCSWWPRGSGYNLSRFDKPVFISSGLGVTLASADCAATYSGTYEGYWSMPCALHYAAEPSVDIHADESVEGAELQHLALDYVRNHENRLVPVTLAKLGRAFGFFHPMQQIHLDSYVETRPHRWAVTGLVAYYVLLALSVGGTVILRRRRIPSFPLWAVGLQVVCSVALTFGQTRYRTTFEVSLVLLAAVQLEWFWSRCCAGTGGRGPAPDRSRMGGPILPDRSAEGRLSSRSPIRTGTGRPSRRTRRDHVGRRDQMPNDPKMLVVLPALNEERSVGIVVKEVRTAAPDGTVLVIDDGSVDGTAVQAREAGAEVVSNPFNLGVGGAMRVGFRVAEAHGYDVLVQVDADGQHDARDIGLLTAAFDDEPGPQVVIGARFAGQGDIAVPRARRAAMRLLARYLSRVTGTKLTDVTSGFRAHNRAGIELFARQLSGRLPLRHRRVADHRGRRRRPGAPGAGDHAPPTGRARPVSHSARAAALPAPGGDGPGALGLPPPLQSPRQPATKDGGPVTGVHIIALVSALITLTIIIELSRRRHLHEKYAIIWLAVAVVIAFFAVFPGAVQLPGPRLRGEEPAGPPDGDWPRCSSDGVRPAQLGGRPPRGPVADAGRRGGAAPQGPRRPDTRALLSRPTPWFGDSVGRAGRPGLSGRGVSSLRRSSGHDRRVPAGAGRRPAGVVLLVVLLFDVDRPDVVVGTVDVLDGQHGRVHGVVLVVVLVHAVAAHRVDVGGVLLEPRGG